ncbi:M1 family metallopeptidase [Novosphingobium sp.]|uniref:M1 family metallopeptidase n=1 Tax=Novosphingobium sp. TaxID=1874826 RepID=UPI00334141BC
MRSAHRLFPALALTGSVLSLIVAAPALADTNAPAPAAAFPAEGTLAHTAIPGHYTIAIRPDATARTFAGTVGIDIAVPVATRTIVLNASALKLGAARLIRAKGRATPLVISYDEPEQTVTLTAPAPIVPGSYRLDIRYTGPIGTQADGLFALDYNGTDGKPTRALFTQFEPSSARQFAPMFDEPSYKATFDLSVVVPADRMAVSNMPVASEAPAGPGLKTVTFRTTPKMSSYLLFFGTGDFERLAKMTSVGVEAGIVAPRGSGEQARFALNELAGLIPYYNDYFGQNYPLPKIDNIAGPGQSEFFSAMENWGAVFTFQRDLLDDPKVTSPRARQFISEAQAHEVAHQWFGDLVTMAWWDDLWLNEGFASWMETKATDHFHPDWSMLVTRVAGREAAMGLDAFRTTHPIVQHIRTVNEANQAFDAITYQKGEAVLAMLEAYAGEDTWRNGIRAYMAAHKFGNSHTIDLWNAVEAAGASGLTTIATDFTTQPGIPLVRVASQTCTNGMTTLTLTQDEFTRDRVGEASTRRWHVPLLVAAGGAAPVRSIMADGRATLTIDGCGPVVINAGQLGYYRSLYTPAGLAALTAALPGLAPIDQRGLVSDQLELGLAGYQPLAPVLDLLAAVPRDASARVAVEAVQRFAGDSTQKTDGLYDRLSGDADAQARLAARAIALWQPRLATLGYDPRDGEALPDADLRSTLVKALGHIGEPGVLAAARARFAALDHDPHALDGALKQDWIGIIARNASPADWDKLARLAQASTSTVDRSNLFTALGSARDVALARRALDLALTDQPGATTSAAIISEVANEHSELAFDFFIAHRDAILALVDASARTTYIERLAAHADSAVMVDKLTAYAATLPADAKKPVARAISRLNDRLSVKARVARETTAWLAKQS